MLGMGRKFLGLHFQARSSGGSSGIWCFRPSERYNVQGIGGGVKEFVKGFATRRNTWNQDGHGPCSEGEGRGQCWSNPHSALGGNWAIHVVPAKRQKNKAHGVSRGWTPNIIPSPKGAKD